MNKCSSLSRVRSVTSFREIQRRTTQDIVKFALFFCNSKRTALSPPTMPFNRRVTPHSRSKYYPQFPPHPRPVSQPRTLTSIVPMRWCCSCTTWFHLSQWGLLYPYEDDRCIACELPSCEDCVDSYMTVYEAAPWRNQIGKYA